jgi:hypothetical protein
LVSERTPVKFIGGKALDHENTQAPLKHTPFNFKRGKARYVSRIMDAGEDLVNLFEKELTATEANSQDLL